jgi:hypothetical protein
MYGAELLLRYNLSVVDIAMLKRSATILKTLKYTKWAILYIQVVKL